MDNTDTRRTLQPVLVTAFSASRPTASRHTLLLIPLSRELTSRPGFISAAISIRFPYAMYTDAMAVEDSVRCRQGG